MVYEFDIYIRAAKEIQRHFRGYRFRKRIFGSMKNYIRKLIKV